MGSVASAAGLDWDGRAQEASALCHLCDACSSRVCERSIGDDGFKSPSCPASFTDEPSDLASPGAFLVALLSVARP